MSVILKQTVTRPTLQDFFWTEFLQTTESELLIDILKFRNAGIVDNPEIPLDIDQILARKNELRPDVINQINENSVYSLLSDPLLLSFVDTIIYKDIETFRQANGELFSTRGQQMIDLIKKTNNTFVQRIYDENGVFLENGVFNIE
jgi:hypothetical protein